MITFALLSAIIFGGQVEGQTSDEGGEDQVSSMQDLVAAHGITKVEIRHHVVKGGKLAYTTKVFDDEKRIGKLRAVLRASKRIDMPEKYDIDEKQFFKVYKNDKIERITIFSPPTIIRVGDSYYFMNINEIDKL